MKTPFAPNRWILTAPLVLGICTVLFARLAIQDSRELEKVYDHGLHASLMAGKVSSLDDLIARYELAQDTYLPVVLPDTATTLIQPEGLLVFDPAGSGKKGFLRP